MQNPDSSQKPPPPETSALFAANKDANARSMAPAVGLPTVVGYRPSGRMGGWSLPLALASLLVVPVVAALLYVNLWFFGNWLLLSQIGLGLVVGAMLFPAVHVGKMRNPIAAGILGALVGAATFGAAMGLEAWHYRPQYVAGESAYIAKKYHLSPAKARGAAERFYTPQNTVKFYWQDSAQAGMTISDSNASATASTTHIGGTMFWAMQAFEALMAMSLAALVAAHFAGRRFSEELNRWFICKNFGAVHPLHLVPLIAALEAGDYVQASKLRFTAKKENQHGPQVSAAYLPQKAGAILTVKARTSKGMRTVFERDLTNDQMKAFWPAFPSPGSASSVPASPFSS